MEYVRAVEAIIPGVQGRVLGALARTHGELSMRQVATVAGVSPTQAGEVLGRLVALGVVTRRDVGRSALVTLDRSNAAGQLVDRLASLHLDVVQQLRVAAREIRPVPESLILFGSFARGEADAGSDVDVLAVRPDGVAADDEAWVSSLGRWADTASAVAGNPLHLLDVSRSEVAPGPALDTRLWKGIVTDGIALVGPAPEALRAP